MTSRRDEAKASRTVSAERSQQLRRRK